MSKDKTNDFAIKKMEKTIKAWENEKAYPTLEDIYQMAYIIKVNPGELLAIRNRGRKQFFKEVSDDEPRKRRDWFEITDNFSAGFGVVARIFLGIALVFFCVGVYMFTNTYFGEPASIVTEQVIIHEIQNYTEPENMVNDGTVRNMIKRVKNESTVVTYDKVY